MKQELIKYQRLFSLYKIEYKLNERIKESIYEFISMAKNDMIFCKNEKMPEHDAIRATMNDLEYKEWVLYYCLKEAYYNYKHHDAKVFMYENFIKNLPKDKVKLINRHLVKVL